MADMLVRAWLGLYILGVAVVGVRLRWLLESRRWSERLIRNWRGRCASPV
jgi:hypothetical protein